MSKVRAPAERLDPRGVASTFVATMSGQYADRKYKGVTGLRLHDGRERFRCDECALMWETAGAVVQHRRLDLPHVPGGATPYVIGPSLDTYVSSESDEPGEVPGQVALIGPALPPAAVQAARRPRRGELDGETFLDVQGRSVAVSMTEFLDRLLDSREAAKHELVEQRERADRAIAREQNMRNVLMTMRDMLDKVLKDGE
jgi:hypothetical protein